MGMRIVTEFNAIAYKSNEHLACGFRGRWSVGHLILAVLKELLSRKDKKTSLKNIMMEIGFKEEMSIPCDSGRDKPFLCHSKPFSWRERKQ